MSNLIEGIQEIKNEIVEANKFVQFPNELFKKAKINDIAKLSKKYFGTDFVEEFNDAFYNLSLDKTTDYNNYNKNVRSAVVRYDQAKKDKGRVEIEWNDGDEIYGEGVALLVPGIPLETLKHMFSVVFKKKFGSEMIVDVIFDDDEENVYGYDDDEDETSDEWEDGDDLTYDDGDFYDSKIDKGNPISEGRDSDISIPLKKFKFYLRTKGTEVPVSHLSNFGKKELLK